MNNAGYKKGYNAKENTIWTYYNASYGAAYNYNQFKARDVVLYNGEREIVQSVIPGFYEGRTYYGPRIVLEITSRRDISIKGEIKKGFYYNQQRFFIKQSLENAHFSVGNQVQFADDSVRTIKDIQAHGPNVHYFYDGDLVNVNAVAGRAIKRVFS